MPDQVKGLDCCACKYFVEDGNGIGAGRCHRRAPVAGCREGAVWPNVWSEYYCGEFEPRPGTGKGTNLTAVDVDENFNEIEQRMESLEDNPPTAVS